MSKPALDRLDDTLNLINDIYGDPKISIPIKNYVEQWAEANGKVAIGEKLSLGGFMIKEDQKLVRRYRRALLLAMLYNGKQANKATVERIDQMTAKTRFIDEFKRNKTPHLGGSLAESYHIWATAEEKEWSKGACAEVPGLLDRTLAGLARVGIDGTEKARFEKWFGTYNQGKHATVVKNYTNIRTTPKGIMLHYWGPNAVSKAGGVVWEYLLSTTKENIIPDAGKLGFVNDGAKPMLKMDPDFHHIFICNLFFGDKVKLRGKAGSYMSRAAGILHELTHNVNMTNDAWYGSVACSEKAKANDPGCLTCASNFQWYAEEFNAG